jgi:hypothetical protein
MRSRFWAKRLHPLQRRRSVTAEGDHRGRWNTISRERKNALDAHSRPPVRSHGTRGQVVCRHEPHGSIASLATVASARWTSSTPNRGH